MDNQTVFSLLRPVLFAIKLRQVLLDYFSDGSLHPGDHLFLPGLGNPGYELGRQVVQWSEAGYFDGQLSQVDYLQILQTNLAGFLTVVNHHDGLKLDSVGVGGKIAADLDSVL